MLRRTQAIKQTNCGQGDSRAGQSGLALRLVVDDVQRTYITVAMGQGACALVQRSTVSTLKCRAVWCMKMRLYSVNHRKMFLAARNRGTGRVGKCGRSSLHRLKGRVRHKFKDRAPPGPRWSGGQYLLRLICTTTKFEMNSVSHSREGVLRGGLGQERSVEMKLLLSEKNI